jgi:replicative DNA helicase
MDGLRGLTFLGGSPGTGKTSLALWVAFDAARANPDTVVVFVTCEMSAKEVQASLITQRAVILFDQLMKGRPGQQPAANGMMLPPGDIANLEKARRDIAALGDRWRIVQPSDFGGAFVGSKRGGAGVFAPITAMANRAKQASGAERMLVVVDSLQRVPVAEPVSGSVTGWMGEAIERDNYVVDALNALASGTGDAVVCITEQNKAQQGTASITSMRGTGSIGYACDNALMLTDPEAYANKDAGEATRTSHYNKGYRLVEAHLTKGRQGSKRGSELLRFTIDTHTFREGSE